jgi:L-threonylcarbamoyladenylate synthase
LLPPLPNIRRLRAYLKRGGVIAYATESCFGLGCDPENRQAVQSLLRMKGRPQSKGLILIGADRAQFRRYLAPLPTVLLARLGAWWPGPNHCSCLLQRTVRVLCGVLTPNSRCG